MNYLYNGVELPELPDWDKTKFPYACILLSDYSKNPDDTWNPKCAYLCISSQPMFAAIGEEWSYLYAKNPVELRRCVTMKDSSTVGWDFWGSFDDVIVRDTTSDYAEIGIEAYAVIRVYTKAFGNRVNDDRVVGANHNIYNLATGELYFAANFDPVPVDPPAVAPEVEPKAFMAGLRMGQFIRGMRG